MKVPIRYKSSDRYNAGVDVVYDDESKLQYAPFIYATTASGDNGGDSGDDEEGEDVMIVNVVDGTTDATWNDIKAAVDDNKLVLIKSGDTVVSTDPVVYEYVTGMYGTNSGYYIEVITSSYNGNSVAPSAYRYTAVNATDNMKLEVSG